MGQLIDLGWVNGGANGWVRDSRKGGSIQARTGMVAESFYLLPSVYWLRGHGSVRFHFIKGLCVGQLEMEFLLRETTLLDWFTAKDFADHIVKNGLNVDALILASNFYNRQWPLAAKVLLTGDRDAFGKLKGHPGGKDLRDEVYKQGIWKRMR